MKRIIILITFLAALLTNAIPQESGIINKVEKSEISKINNVDSESIARIGNVESPGNCVSCKQILENNPGSPDGFYTIDPDGSGPLEEFECYCDMNTDGGGWTLVTIHSDDGQATWTYNNRALFYNNATVGNTDDLSQDYKGRGMVELNFTDILFIHAPSAIWAVYNNVGNGTTTLGYLINNSPHPYCNNEPGYSMSSGTLSTTGTSLCSTDLYFNVGDYDGQSFSYCINLGQQFNDATYGPAWSADQNSGCPFDDPGVFSSMGPDVRFPDTEQSPVGFGKAAGLNTGTAGSGENHIKVFIR